MCTAKRLDVDERGTCGTAPEIAEHRDPSFVDSLDSCSTHAFIA